MDLLKEYPSTFAIGAAVLIILENVLPHLPVKANSTVQIIINVAKAIFGKKA